MLSQKLLNIGIVLMDFSNPSMAYRYIDTLKPKDVVISISHSGISKTVVSFLEQCREQGAITICITNYMDAPITAVSDIRLITAAGREAPLWGEPIAVRPSQVALVDALYTVLSILKYKREQQEPHS
jgi:DNA-binding MurR/RpiR family transcriptional regulator